jgi:hypothetical protein
LNTVAKKSSIKGVDLALSFMIFWRKIKNFKGGERGNNIAMLCYKSRVAPLYEGRKTYNLSVLRVFAVNSSHNKAEEWGLPNRQMMNDE